MADKDELGDLREKLKEARIALAGYHLEIDEDDPDRDDMGATVDQLLRAEDHAKKRYQAAGSD